MMAIALVLVHWFLLLLLLLNATVVCMSHTQNPSIAFHTDLLLQPTTNRRFHGRRRMGPRRDNT